MITPYAPATAAAGQKLAAANAELIRIARSCEHGPEEAARLAWGPGSRLTFEECAEFWRRAAGLPPAERAA